MVGRWKGGCVSDSASMKINIEAQKHLFHQMEIEVDKNLVRTVELMDADKDGKITYQEFLIMQFRSLLDKDKLKD